MPVFKDGDVNQVELFPRVNSSIVGGENLTLSLLTLTAGSVVPEHNHPQEQGGLVISGRIEFTIGGEANVLEPGDMFVIPSDVPHSVRVFPESDSKVLDIFSPCREDLEAKAAAAQ
jgi:quercetin dioxygenase-like cupin family protein